MKIIFLDIDGVMSTPGRWKERDTHTYPSGKQSYGLTQSCVNQLKRILDSTDARVVLSSTWRKLFVITDMVWLFTQYGLLIPLVGYTDYYEKSGRGAEIEGWLRNNPDTSSYVVIDDDMFDMRPIPQNRRVQCCARRGLTTRNADRAIRVLMEKIDPILPDKRIKE